MFKLSLILITVVFAWTLSAMGEKGKSVPARKTASSGEFICEKKNEQFFNNKDASVEAYLNETCDPTRTVSIDTRAHGHGGLICCVAK